MKKFDTLFWQRVIPFICSLIFLFFFFIFFKDLNYNFLSILVIVSLGVSVILSIFLSFFPKHFRIYGITAFIYSFLFSLFEQYSVFMIFSFVVTVVFLWHQGFFAIKKNLKLLSAILYFSILMTIRIIKFPDSFIDHVVQFLPYIIFSLVITLFVINSYTLKVGRKKKSIINVNDLELTENQKNLMLLILSNKPYKEFAIDNNMSVSVVKKEALIIFKYFNLCSKNAFIAKFSHFTFIYNNKTYTFAK
jgi:DNA-binding CsgD family transcriptional regulator